MAGDDGRCGVAVEVVLRAGRQNNQDFSAKITKICAKITKICVRYERCFARFLLRLPPWAWEKSYRSRFVPGRVEGILQGEALCSSILSIYNSFQEPPVKLAALADITVSLPRKNYTKGRRIPGDDAPRMICMCTARLTRKFPCQIYSLCGGRNELFKFFSI